MTFREKVSLWFYRHVYWQLIGDRKQQRAMVASMKRSLNRPKRIVPPVLADGRRVCQDPDCKDPTGGTLLVTKHGTYCETCARKMVSGYFMQVAQMKNRQWLAGGTRKHNAVH